MSRRENSDLFWLGKINAFLHDPPDKALKFIQHEARRDIILSKYLIIEMIKKDIKKSDVWSSSIQRISLEKTNQTAGAPVIKPVISFYPYTKNNHQHIAYPLFKHPIKSSIKEYKVLGKLLEEIKENYNDVEAFINDLTEVERIEFDNLMNHENHYYNFLQLWQNYPLSLKSGYRKLFQKSNKWKDTLKKLFSDIEENEIIDILCNELVNLPADTKCPDHTIWDHMDITSAIYGVLQKGTPSVLLFKINPVQPFINNARKTQDLWSGSHLLSLLTFEAIKVIIKQFGPDCIIYPHLRGQPFLDSYFETFNEIDSDSKQKENLNTRIIANIPNKFLAIVPSKNNASKSKNKLSGSIKNTINENLRELFDEAWEKYLEKNIVDKSIDRKFQKEKAINTLLNYFKITIQSLPIPFIPKYITIPYEESIKYTKSLDLPKNIEEKYSHWLSILADLTKKESAPFDLYPLMFEILDQSVGIESKKFYKEVDIVGYKCTLCGELDSVGGSFSSSDSPKKSKDAYKQTRILWSDIVTKNNLFNTNERLCPVCLIKRHYPVSEFLYEKLKLKKNDIKIPSVTDIALRKKDWLSKISEKDLEEYQEVIKSYLSIPIGQIDFSSLYYKEKLNEEALKKKYPQANISTNLEKIQEKLEEIIKKVGEPDRYYTILKIDGDNIGTILFGDQMEKMGSYFHPHILELLDKEKITEANNIQRLLTPSVHIALSRALQYFSVVKVPAIVEKYKGELIYSGGDDVLAFVPSDKGLRCAYDIQDCFRKEWEEWNILPGATMSAGILNVHHQHPLNDALVMVEELIKNYAKKLGGGKKDAFSLGIHKRSGALRIITAKWEIINVLKRTSCLKLLKNRKKKEINTKQISEQFLRNSLDLLIRLRNPSEDMIRILLDEEIKRHYQNMSEEEKTASHEKHINEIFELSEHIYTDNNVKERNKIDTHIELFSQIKDTLYLLLALTNEEIEVGDLK